MGGKCYNSYKIQLWCSALLILVLESGGCCLLNSEGRALMEFQSSVYSDPYGAFTNWTRSVCDPCLWFGVQCVDGKVQILLNEMFHSDFRGSKNVAQVCLTLKSLTIKRDLNGFALEGVLASELGQLTQLTTLILSDNHFSGTIPKEFGGLKKLEVLDLRNNNLSGSIPAEIGDMQSLKSLLVCDNNFKGSFPLELEKLNLLSELQFDEDLSSGTTGIRCINRKLGHCLWRKGSYAPKKSDSLIVPFKVTVLSYVNLLPLFIEDCSEPLKKADSVIHLLKGTFCRYFNQLSLFKFGQKFLDGHADDLSDNVPTKSDPGVISNAEKRVRIVRRRLYEYGSPQSENLLAPPASNVNPQDKQIIALPSSRSSGSYPAIQGPKQAPTPSPTTTTSSAQGSFGASRSAHPAGESNTWKYVVGASVGSFLLLSLVVMVFVSRSKAVKNIAPWKTGLSGQLQKAFVTGVPMLKRSELETACEDFSNIIDTQEGYILYKGTLSSGVEIAVISTTIPSLKEWSKRVQRAFQKKIDQLSRVNHKNFVNLIGYCEEDEPFVRMMVFEYAPNGSLYEHLHVKELEQIDWNGRMRIIMGTAYCLQYMHGLNPPVHHSNLNSNSIRLTDDYAAKIMETSFWKELSRKSKISSDNNSEHSQSKSSRSLCGTETDVYNFAVLCLEIITGKLLYSEEHGHLVNWAKEYLNNKEKWSCLIDPTLKSFKDVELEIVCEIIQECIQVEGRKKPNMTEMITKLRGVIDISPEHATPRLSPLWWAELEILSAEAP